MKRRIVNHRDLEVYGKAFDLAMEIFELTKTFPKEETYSLVDQVRRSSRSVCANIAEAWRKRRYAAAFVAKLSDAEAETAETQVWLEFAVKCGYVDRVDAKRSYRLYNEVLRTLIGMMNHPETWTLNGAGRLEPRG
jgi:four helix bundle protein